MCIDFHYIVLYSYFQEVLMYYIVEVDGKLRQIIDTKGKANKYGDAKLFKTRKEAEAWTLKHYEIKEYHES